MLMRRCAIAILLALGLCGVGASQDKAGPVTVEYNGQSFFIVTTSKGKRIAFDPHFIEAYLLGKPLFKPADIICISHNHNDHVQVGVFARAEDKKPKVLRGLKGTSLKADWNPIDETIDKDIKFKSVNVYHDDQEGFQRGKNAVFIVEVDGWRICHLGDLGHILTPAQLKRIGQVDVLMVPCGGIYTLNGTEANRVVEQLKPKEYIFPMHYGTSIFEDILTAEEFLDIRERQDKNKVVRLSESEKDPTKRANVISLNRDATRPRPLVVQLHYWPKEDAPKKKEKGKDKEKK
jgi:L-ascorbate metabolism protein UlaG (beta-lactamase superfamily)